MNSDFMEELAAKLNARPQLPFRGGARRCGTSPMMATEHTSIASGDTTPGSLSPGSFSTVGRRSQEGSGVPIQDSYMEGARLRIRLNRQRKHRPRASQLDTGDSIGSLAATSPLNCIGEEDGGSSPPPLLVSPKPRTSVKISSSECESSAEEVSHSPRSSSSINSDISSDVSDSKMKLLSQESHDSFTAERIRFNDDDQEGSGEMKEVSPSKPLQQGETFHHETSRQNMSSQGDEEKDQEHTWLSISDEAPHNRAFEVNEQVKELSHKVSNRPISMPVEFSTASTATPIRTPIVTQKVTPPPSRLVEVEDGSGKAPRLSPTLGVNLRTRIESQKSKIAPLDESEPYPAVRLRPTPQKNATPQSDKGRTKFASAVIERDANRHSRVCELVKIFQQGRTT
ncbi:hypothetical protein ECG_00065 [Echinococcus granulosus]|nr:hypothetical protein ECG_00065 [Echinococcus granulosus]